MPGTLYVAATPIGNLADASARLAQVLAAAACVVAEDTRVSGRLLAHLGIDRPLRSLHEHNERQAVNGLLNRLADDQTLVLVSDAGTPLVSDPGYRLVAAAREAGHAVIPVPGPSAVTAALSVSGLPTDAFAFRGFLSARTGERRRQLEALARRPETQVLFESSHRIGALIDDAMAVLGADRDAFLAREMTKRHEQYVRASLETLARGLASGEIPRRGEFVLLVAGARVAPGGAVAAETILQALAAELPPSQAAKLAARITGLPRKTCFARIADLKNTPG